MKNEPKTDVLLRMMEQPERYTEEQWRDILSDNECRELYTLMALTRGSFDAAKADAELTDEEIEREWEKVMKVKSEKYNLPEESDTVHERNSHFSFFTFHFSFKKIAAIFLAAAFLGGLAWAFVPRLLSPKTIVPQSAMVTTLPLEGERGGGLLSFSNLRLDSILTVVAAHYECEICFRDTTAQALRLSTVWDRDDSLSVFLETLNEFDGLRLTDERDTIFVESLMVEDK
jgi:hypothetical protein